MMKDISSYQDSKSSMRELLENYPLYCKVKFEIPKSPDYLRPDVLFLDCPICKSKLPFRDGNSFSGLPTGGVNPRGKQREVKDGEIYEFYYQCTGCLRQEFRSWVQISLNPGAVQKVGQVPAQSINVDKQVSSHLGQDLQLYKRAKICLSQSYGLAACAYMRRILENQINSIIDIICETQKQDNGSEKSLKELLNIKKSRVLDNKLKLAYKFAPQSIIVEGQNPLKLMYELLSNNVHEKSEDECTQVAHKLLSIFEYVIVELKRQKENKEKFINSIQSISSQCSKN